MALSTRPGVDPAPERKPGEFRRHPDSGAPQVVDPAKARKRKGKKADLIKAAEAEGIVVPDKVTVPELHELLGPEPGLSWFGRPSSLGKQIENMTNLQKWSERAVALGILIDADLLDDLRGLDPDQLNLDDDQARELLDKAAVKAKKVARTGIAADRGTHTHGLTEDVDLDDDWLTRAEAGEDLGIPRAAQQALVAAWQQMLERNELEILAVEATCVDDRWRQAGTLDRIARLGKDLRFVVNGGEIVTLPAGLVIVLDVKTGSLRVDHGAPMYWHGYAVQIASYAQSVRYDPDTGTRSDWEWPIDQQWALIAHLDVLAAIAGTADCRLVLVDLAAGRDAGERCVWARQWEKRTDVFSLVTDDDSTLVSVPVEIEEKADEFDSPAALPTADVPDEVETSVEEGDARLSFLQPVDDIARVKLPRDPDEGADLDDDQAAGLRKVLGGLNADGKAWLSARVAETMRAGATIHMGDRVTERRMSLCRALAKIAIEFVPRGPVDADLEAVDEITRAAAAWSIGPEIAHAVAHPLGAVIACMSAAEANEFDRVVTEAVELRMAFGYRDDGTPYLAAPAA